MTARPRRYRIENLAVMLALCPLLSLQVGAEGNPVDLVNRQVLRVCSDPANMPFSNENLEGFENKIAAIVADELNIPIEYTWFPDAVGFVRRTLFERTCDVIIGFAQGDDLVLNTNAYYRSSYVLVYPKGATLDGVTSLSDSRLKGKRIGIVAGTPPANIMAREGLMPLAKPYALVVDRRYFSPAEEMVADIRSGVIDAGILWGPMGGYFATRGSPSLEVQPLREDPAGPRFAYRITMGVRPGEDVWKRELNAIIAKRQLEIDAVLRGHGVPLLSEQDMRGPRPQE